MLVSSESAISAWLSAQSASRCCRLLLRRRSYGQLIRRGLRGNRRGLFVAVARGLTRVGGIVVFFFSIHCVMLVASESAISAWLSAQSASRCCRSMSRELGYEQLIRRGLRGNRRGMFVAEGRGPTRCGGIVVFLFSFHSAMLVASESAISAWLSAPSAFRLLAPTAKSPNASCSRLPWGVRAR